MIRIDRVLTNEEVQKLETEPVYTAVVEAPQMSGFLQFIGRSLPKLENLDHVKRVKRDPSSGQLTVLLCQSNKISEHQIRDIFDQTDGWKLVNISTAEVPRTPPYTKQQFDLWKQTWPVSFRPLEKLRNLQQQIAEEEMMTYAEKMYGELCQMQGRGAIIVDGSSKQELARSIGERHVHPLRHSVMCCVDQVGKQEVEKRKRKDQTENLAGGGYLCENADVFCHSEPCAMCCMALVHSRIGRLFFVYKSKKEVVGCISEYRLQDNPKLNHHFTAFQITPLS
ncbi:tRNA-specific adenosine deaminase subunit tad3 [Coemansia sp. RSA 1722]|nr:tRNA-specific adenosine deaminase subunit tad3 [Coemansia sp. RSA 1722]